jgi:hypothetical protein
MEVLLCVNHVVPVTIEFFQQPTITSITSITCNCDVIVGDVESAPKKPKTFASELQLHNYFHFQLGCPLLRKKIN